MWNRLLAMFGMTLPETDSGVTVEFMFHAAPRSWPALVAWA